MRIKIIPSAKGIMGYNCLFWSVQGLVHNCPINFSPEIQLAFWILFLKSFNSKMIINIWHIHKKLRWKVYECKNFYYVVKVMNSQKDGKGGTRADKMSRLLKIGVSLNQAKRLYNVLKWNRGAKRKCIVAIMLSIRLQNPCSI